MREPHRELQWERSEERLLYHRESFRYQRLESEQRLSAHHGPTQEAGPTQRRGPLSGLAYLILFFFLGTAIGAFYPFVRRVQ